MAGDLATSAVSLAELHFGVLCAPDDESRTVRLQRLTAIESRYDALPVDSVVARHYGRLAAQVGWSRPAGSSAGLAVTVGAGSWS